MFTPTLGVGHHYRCAHGAESKPLIHLRCEPQVDEGSMYNVVQHWTISREGDHPSHQLGTFPEAEAERAAPRPVFQPIFAALRGARRG